MAKLKILTFVLIIAVVDYCVMFKPGFYYSNCLFRTEFHWVKPKSDCKPVSTEETSNNETTPEYFEYAENCQNPKLPIGLCIGLHTPTKAIANGKKLHFSFIYPNKFKYHPVNNNRQGVWLVDSGTYKPAAEYPKDWQNEIVIYYDLFDEKMNGELGVASYDEFIVFDKIDEKKGSNIYKYGIRYEYLEKVTERRTVELNGKSFVYKPALMLETTVGQDENVREYYYYLVDITVDGDKYMFYFKFNKGISEEAITDVLGSFQVYCE